jgi:VIT1/CCC1 family predicted Fe2+/Mn2+ transporter
MSDADRLARLERRVTWLAVCFTVFVLAHAVLIPLLPRLFSMSSEAAVGALVAAVATLAFVVVSRLRG